MSREPFVAKGAMMTTASYDVQRKNEETPQGAHLYTRKTRHLSTRATSKYLDKGDYDKTSPDGGGDSLIFLGGGMPVSGCPCGRDELCLIQHLLSSQAESARFSNV